MNRKHQEVQVWLETVFGDKSVPAYELNETTVRILHELMGHCHQREKNTQLLIEDLRQKADEYSTEAVRIEKILERMSLTSSCLSQSGTKSLRTLADLALILHTKDASDTSFLLALQHLEDELVKVDEALKGEQRVLDSLIQKTKTAVIKNSALKKTLEELAAISAGDGPAVEKQARETQFVRTKAKEYKAQVAKLEGHLTKLKVEPSLYHKALTERAEELSKLKQEIAPMKKKLDSYHKLPPNTLQAHMKLDELKDQVAALEEELKKKIDVMLI